MRLDGIGQSSNVEDRRGRRGPMMAGGGGGLIIVLIVLAMRFLGAPPEAEKLAVQIGQGLQNARSGDSTPGPGIDDDAKKFIATILQSTEDVWGVQFRQHVQGGGYQPPKLILFSGTDTSACGVAQSEMGPFYCPADRKVYIDPSFFQELAERHRASGDFAQAYVIAHEVAHHVQNLTGMNQPVQDARSSGDELAANQMSVRLELQADYLAGVWAHHAQTTYNVLEDGDIEEGINAAHRIGDDTLQQEATGQVDPERFTHGTSEQRVRWFRKGLTSGDFEGCEELFKLPYERL